MHSIAKRKVEPDENLNNDDVSSHFFEFQYFRVYGGGDEDEDEEEEDNHKKKN